MPGPPTIQDALRLYRAGRLDAAAESCRRILKRDRDQTDALAMLCQIATLLRRYEEAGGHIRRCLKRAPKRVDYLALQAELHRAEGQFSRALTVYDKILRLQPKYTPAIAGKAEVLLVMNEHDKAFEVLRPLVDAGKEDGCVALVYARCAPRCERAEHGIEVASRHVDDAGLAVDHRRGLHFAIGQGYERLGDHERAFAAYAEANRLSPGRWDREKNARGVDALIEFFSRERIDSLPRATSRPELPVFIIGMPRSGSTLTEQIIDAHPLAHGAGELDLIPRLMTGLPERLGSRDPFPACLTAMTQDDVDRASREYLDQLRRRGRSAKRVVDKYLGNYMFLGALETFFPGARVIHCRRNAVDTCLSCYTQKFPMDSNYYASDLAALGAAYRQYERVMDHWRRTLSLPLLEVDYEEIVADQEKVSRTIIGFCGLEWDDRCLRFYESKRVVRTLSSDQVSRPIYTSSVGRADRFGALLDPLREALAG